MKHWKEITPNFLLDPEDGPMVRPSRLFGHWETILIAGCPGFLS
jgi:hypothetical protein